MSKNSTDWLLHFVGGGVLAALELAVTGNAWLAVFWPTLISFARESEQARLSRKSLEAMTGRRYHPSDIRQWGNHKISEFLAFTAGALFALGCFALL